MEWTVLVTSLLLSASIGGTDAQVIRDCAASYDAGQTTSGVYPIAPGVEAYCDMDTAGGGWTVIQRRQDGSVLFDRTWVEYKQGFGNVDGEYWLGNDNIHLLTQQKDYTLRIDMMDWEGESRFAEYSTFKVSGESDQYRLTLTGYTGTAGDSMGQNDGYMFSTVDRDNDVRSDFHCSQKFGQGGWWYPMCGHSYLNGRYLGNCSPSCPGVVQGVMWYDWTSWTTSLKSVSMKIRPTDNTQWQEVFSTVKGTGQTVYDAWSAGTDDQVLHNKCQVVERWGSLNIQRVKVVLESSSGNVELIFDGKNTDKFNWFSKFRLLSSPWNDINTEPQNFFSIEGASIYRRFFYINRSWGGCPEDYGWLVVADTGPNQNCPWERAPDDQLPYIMFSKTASFINFNNPDAVEIADRMVIYIDTPEDVLCSCDAGQSLSEDGTSCHKSCGVDKATCCASGDPHYKMFDGTFYDFQGPCRYILTEDCANGDFIVEVQQEPAPWNPSVSLVRQVYVIAYGERIGILQGKNVVTAKGPSFPNFDLAMGKIKVRLSGLVVRVELTQLCVVVTYDGSSTVKVEVTSNYQNMLCGLCGNYNSIEGDDRLKPDGTIASGWNDFGNSWETDPKTCLGDRPTSFPPIERPCEDSLPCNVLIDPASEKFKDCHGYVNPKPYWDNCIFDTCATNGQFLCASLELYYDDCMAAGVAPFVWRTPDLCPVECPENSAYSICTSACPATCVNPNAPGNCNLPCVEGCECDAGYRQSGLECVPQANCGCIDEDGFYRTLGEVWRYDGQECECTTENKIICAALTRADLCAMPGRGICSACGDPHFKTFDGGVHHFQGPCRYTFAKDCGNPSDFTVEVQHKPVPSWPSVSFVRDVFVIAHGYEIGIHENHDVTVDGPLKSVPFDLAGGMIDVSYEGLWVHVQLKKFCVDIYYNGLYHCVKVKVTPYYWNRMCGLCGNYNGYMGDDFMMSDLVTIATNWNVFGHDWLVEDEDDKKCGGRVAPPSTPTCPEGLMAVVSGMCGFIKDTNGPFAACHAVVDPKVFFGDCVFDMCAQNGDTEALCESLGAYADACEDKGVRIIWRSATLCPLSCPPNSHYNPCASPCPPTCQDPDPVCITLCVECCECDTGFILSGRHCVPLEKCGCIDPDTGHYYELDETWVEDGKRCVCKENNNIICTGCSFDIVFILDRSWSIGPYGMYIAEKYIAYIIKCLYGLDVDVGYIVFDCLSKWLISLGLYNVNTPGLIPKIKDADFTGGLSRIGHAIGHMYHTANYRHGIPSAAVVLTDGVAYIEYPDNLDQIQADAARALGIELYAVAVGREFLFNYAALANIAGGWDRVFDPFSCCALAVRLMNDLCALQCPTLTPPLNGALNPVGANSYKDVVTFTCDQGYKLNGASSVTCEADQRWSAPVPTCQRVGCAPLSLSHGTVTCTNQAFYGSQCRVSCDTGYYLSAPTTLECRTDGTWSGSIPVCNECNSALDIIMAVDITGSVAPDIGKVQELLRNLVNRLPIGSGTNEARVGLIRFAWGHDGVNNIGTDDVTIPLTQSTSKVTLLNQIDTITSVSTGSSCGNSNSPSSSGGQICALQSLYDQFLNNQRSGVKQIAVIVTDGREAYPPTTAIAPAQTLRDSGVTIVCVGVANVDMNTMSYMASDPFDDHYFASTMSNLDELVDLLNPIICG